MVTLPDSEAMFEPLLQSIQDKTAPTDDRVDVYLRLTERLRGEEDIFLAEVCKHVADLTVAFKRDTLSLETDLSQAALQALGHCLYQEQIVRSFSEVDSKALLEVLAHITVASEDKGVCTRALWCIAKQNLPASIVSDQIQNLMSCLDDVLKKGLQSTTVDHEAISVVERLLEQLPQSIMAKTADQWSKLIFHMTVSSAPKVREQALSVLSSNLELLLLSQQQVVQGLLPVLKSGLVSELAKLFTERKELFVLRVWSCIVPVLGKVLHRGGTLINEMLKLVEQGFKNPSVDVQVNSYSAWSILIDNFALSQDVLYSPRRMKLLMMPLLNCVGRERNERIETARLSTWWHFVCSLDKVKVAEMFEQVCVPLLQFIFGTSITHISLFKTKEGFGDLKCPPTPTNGKLMADTSLQTPKSNVRRSLRDVGTPKTPTVNHASFAQATKQKLLLQGCVILAQLLQTNKFDRSANPRFSLAENLKNGIFTTPETFEKNASVLISAVREAFKLCGYELSDKLACLIWGCLVKHVDLLMANGKKQYDSIFLHLLATVEDVIEGNYLPPNTSLKLLEIVAKSSPRILSHCTTSLHSKGNPQGSAAILLMYLLFTPHVLKEGQSVERFNLVFENFVSCGMEAPTGQLVHLQSTLELLQCMASHIEKKYTLWRLWSSVVSLLNEHINKTNDVNQGNALEHDFTAMHLAFMLPVRYLMDSTLNQTSSKQVSNNLSELYRRFSCAAALVSTAEANTCAEELSVQLLSVWSDHSAKDVLFVDGMVNLVKTVLECLDFSKPSLFHLATTAAGKSPNRTPTKWTKKLQRPIGNLTSTVELLRKLIGACNDLLNAKDTNKSFGIFASLMTNLMDGVSWLFAHISGASIISSAVQVLATSLAPIIRGAHMSRKEKKTNNEQKLYIPKFIQKVEKLWVDILTCIQSRHGGPYNSELLAALSPLLEITFCHYRRQFKNQSVMFWNATFAHAQMLDYPDNIRPVLHAIKDKMFLTLPNWDEAKVSVKETQVEPESEEMSQLTQPSEFTKPLGIPGSPLRRKPLTFSAGSPHIKGSFLHKAVGAVKAVENLSPKKAVSEPRHAMKGRPISTGTHARRKLPLSMFDDDSQDYVAIAPSPTKKRFLTEHQKEVMRSRSEVPALYNCLDQSQDGSMFTPATQERLPAPSYQTDISPPLVEPNESHLNEAEHEENPESTKIKIPEFVPTLDENGLLCDTRTTDIKEIPETMEVDLDNCIQLEEDENTAASLSCTEAPENVQPPEMTSFCDVTNAPKIDCQDTSEDDEMTSPDVIPSSQASIGCDSPFQFPSLRKKSTMIPLNNAVVILDDLAGKEKLSKCLDVSNENIETRQPIKCSDVPNEKIETRKPVKCPDVPNEEMETRKQAKSSSDENEIVIDEKELMSEEKYSRKEESKIEENSSVPSRNIPQKSYISPIAGRTRRGIKQKSQTPQELSTKKSDRTVEESKGSESQESYQSSKREETVTSDIENSECGPEKQDNKTIVPVSCVVSRDVTSSPVSYAKMKFMKPNTGSPNQVPIHQLQSPAASPTTGILKRTNAFTGQRSDSPSPPSKVRRVSFALPLKQDKAPSPASSPEKPTREPDIPEAALESEVQKTTPSRGTSSFTIIKRRRSAPVSNIRSVREPSDKGNCVFPDLVDCNLPVEQILPSLSNSSWSRGLGHVVHAQNIRTIGNLCSLREYQIRNLPIRSPKVETLRKVLSSFHQRTKPSRARWVMKDVPEQTEKTEIVELISNDAMEAEEITGDMNKTVEPSENEQKGLDYQQAKDCLRDDKTDDDVMEKDITGEKTENVEMIQNKETTDSLPENSVTAATCKDLENNLEKRDVAQKTTNETPGIALGVKSGEYDESSTTVTDVEKCVMDVAIAANENSYTPPLPVGHLKGDMATTPKRCGVSKPTVLFTPSDAEDEDVVSKEEIPVIDIVKATVEAIAVIDSDDTLNECGEEKIKEEIPVIDIVKATVEAIAVIDSDDTLNECGEEKSVETIKGPDDDMEQSIQCESTTREEITIQCLEAGDEAHCPLQQQRAAESHDEQNVCNSLSTILEIATPDLLARLSSEELFTAQQDLLVLFSRVSNALKPRCRSPPRNATQK